MRAATTSFENGFGWNICAQPVVPELAQMPIQPAEIRQFWRTRQSREDIQYRFENAVRAPSMYVGIVAKHIAQRPLESILFGFENPELMLGIAAVRQRDGNSDAQFERHIETWNTKPAAA